MLEPHWRDVLLGHFHDILPGSSIARVNREAVATLDARSRARSTSTSPTLTAKLPHGGTRTDRAQPDVAARDGVRRRSAARWFSAEVAPYASAPLTPVDRIPDSRFDRDTMSNGSLTLRSAQSGEIVSCVGCERRPSIRLPASTGSCCTATRTSSRSTPGTSGRSYLKRTPRTLRARDVDDGDRRAAASSAPSATASAAARSTSASFSRPAAISCVSRPPSTGTRSTRCCAPSSARCTSARPSSARSSSATSSAPPSSARRRARAVRGLRAQVDRDRGCGGRLRAAQRQQVRAPGQERPDQPQPAALAHVPRQDGRPRHAPLHLRVHARSRPATSPSVIRDGYRLNNPLLIGPGAELDERRIRRRAPASIIETIKPAERRHGRHRSAVREPRQPHDDRATNSTRAQDRARDRTCMEAPTGPADLDRPRVHPVRDQDISPGEADQ